jgi:hypothetical protein
MSENNMENKESGEDKKVVADRFLNDARKKVVDKLEGVKSSIQKDIDKMGENIAKEIFVSYKLDRPGVKGFKDGGGKEEDISAKFSRDKKGAQKKIEKINNFSDQVYIDKSLQNSRFAQKDRGEKRKLDLMSPVKKVSARFGEKRESVLDSHGYDEATIKKMEKIEERALRLNKYKKKVKKNKEQIKGKIKNKKSGGGDKFKEATGRFLKKCYENAIGSWTLSMFGVYIYIFLLQIPQFNKFFCPIGQEWVPAMIKRKDPKEAKKIGDKIAIVEKPLIGCCCTFHLFLLIIIVFIIYVILNPGKFGWEFLKDFVKDILGRDYED